MIEERFRKYLAFRSLQQIGGADTRELADDLAKEWNGVAYVRVDVADAENAALRDQLAEARQEVQRVSDYIQDQV